MKERLCKKCRKNIDGDYYKGAWYCDDCRKIKNIQSDEKHSIRIKKNSKKYYLKNRDDLDFIKKENYI